MKSRTVRTMNLSAPSKKLKLLIRIEVDLTGDDLSELISEKSNEIVEVQTNERKRSWENTSLQERLAKSAEFCAKLERESRRTMAVVFEGPGFTIRQHDIDKLMPGEWLNDELVNVFVTSAVSKSSNYYAFSSFFLLKYLSVLGRSLRNFDSTKTSKAFADVRRWAHNEDLFAKDLIVFPIHDMNHWSVAVCVWNRENDSNLRGKLFFLDSLGNSHDKELFAHYIRCYLSYVSVTSVGSPDQKAEIANIDDTAPNALTQKDFKFTSANLPIVNLSTLRQNDGCNCGVFAISNVNRFVDAFTDWRQSGTNLVEFEVLLSRHIRQAFDPDAYRIFLKQDLLKRGAAHV